jgi:hypothetical protein
MILNKKIHFGIRGAIPQDVEETRTIPFILSSYTRDRHGTVLNQEQWDLDNYRLNPVVAYQHNLSGGMCSEPNPNFIVGKDVGIGLIGAGNERKLAGATEFEPKEINPLAEQIFRKILFGSLSRTSVGFIEKGQGKFGEGEEAEGRSNETYYFSGQELLEYSIVNIPSNPTAGKRGSEMRLMREEAYGVMMYAFKELGAKFRLSQIEQFRVCDIMDLLDGKDLDLKETDPERVRKLLAENSAQKEQIARLKRILNGN